MTPLNYLRNCTNVNRSCQMIYSKVFEKYINPETRMIHENVREKDVKFTDASNRPLFKEIKKNVLLAPQF